MAFHFTVLMASAAMAHVKEKTAPSSIKLTRPAVISHDLTLPSPIPVQGDACVLLVWFPTFNGLKHVIGFTC